MRRKVHPHDPPYFLRRRLAGGWAFYHDPPSRERQAFPRLRLSDDYATACREAEARTLDLLVWRDGRRAAPHAALLAADGGLIALLLGLVTLLLAVIAGALLAPRLTRYALGASAVLVLAALLA